MSLPAKAAPSADQTALLRRLPSVDELLLRPRIAALCSSVERSYGVATVREVLAQLRREIISGVVLDESAIHPESIEKRIISTVEDELAPSLRPVINAISAVPP
jgi:Selenocysteine synthase N terminal